MLPQLATAALAAKVAGKALKDQSAPEQPAPKSLKESIFRKPVTWAIIAGVGIYLTIKLLKRNPSQQTVSKTVTDITKLQNTGQKQTYLDSQYSSYADALYTAMDGIGTNFDSIMRVFGAMKNDLDVAKLIAAFGIKEDYNLSEWLADDLSEFLGEPEKLNKLLASKGITYRF